MFCEQIGALEKVEAAFANFLMDGEKCRFLLDSPEDEACIVKASILIDVGANGTRQGPQTPHCDWLLDGQGKIYVRRAVIAPTTKGTFSLLIYPKSHKLLRRAAKFHEWDKEWGFTFSSEEKDEAFCEGRPVREPSRIWLDKGEVLVFDAHLVHAGDESRMLPDDEVMPNIR